jgi:ribonuclease HI
MSDSGIIKTGNNQRVELLAIYNAMRHILIMLKDKETLFPNGINEINVYTDSEYSLKCITVWSLSWKNNGWRTSKKQDVKHRDIIEPAFEIFNALKKKHNINIHHVKAHTGRSDYFSMGNSEVDRLANGVARENIL